MKKFVAGVLAAVLLIGVTTTAFARDYYAYVDTDLDYTLAPGQLYTFDVFNESGSYFDDYDKDLYSVSCNITYGEKYVDSFRMKLDSSGQYYQLYVQTSADADYSKPRLVEYTIRAVAKERGGTSTFKSSFKIGYGTDRQVIEEEDCFIYADAPAVTFSDELFEVKANFDNLHYIRFRLTNTYNYNFAYNTKVPRVVMLNNPDADIQAWNFVARPSFDVAATVYYHTAEKLNVYEVDEDGNCTAIDANYTGGSMSWKARALGSYVLSPQKLVTTTPKPEPEQPPEVQAEPPKVYPPTSALVPPFTPPPARPPVATQPTTPTAPPPVAPRPTSPLGKPVDIGKITSVAIVLAGF